MQRRRLKVDGNLLIKSSNREQSACLEILPPEGECSKLNALSLENCNTRPGSAGKVKKAPFVNRANSAPRRTPTPTKQIILEAAKRKQNLEGPFNKCSSKEADSSKNQSHSERNDVRRSEDGKVETGAKDKDDSSHGQNEDDESEDESDDDDDEEEEDSSEDEPLKAPNELMIEFLDCVMNSDYDNGLKLCKMILLYEPENAEALNFKRLIEEKIAIDAGNDEESDDSNENNNDNSEDSNESDDSSDSDTEESTEEEEDDDDKDDGDNKNRDGKQNKDCKQNKL